MEKTSGTIDDNMRVFYFNNICSYIKVFVFDNYKVFVLHSHLNVFAPCPVTLFKFTAHFVYSPLNSYLYIHINVVALVA